MKKLTILFILVLSFCVMSFVSCSAPCEHVVTIDAAVSATCTQDGLTMGSHCSKCNEVIVSQNVIPALGHDKVQKAAQEATCTGSGWNAHEVCSRCDYTTKVEVPKLGHITTNPICSRCGDTFGDWTKKYYVDSFDNPTNEAYITNKDLIQGKFSNSATTNSKLLAFFLIEEDDIAIKMYEYGSYLVKNSYTATYTIGILDTLGNTTFVYGTMYKNGDRIHINDAYLDEVFEILSKPGSVTFYLQEDKYILSTYLFSFETDNFSQLYQYVFGSNIL